MKRLAIVVEGQTELYFVSRLANELATGRQLATQLSRIEGKAGQRRWQTLAAAPEGNDFTHFILIVDAGGDESVASTVIDQSKSLKDKGYGSVLGLRDLFPKPIGQLKRMTRLTESVLQRCHLPARVLIAIHEVETWFMWEHSHFQRVSKKLTCTHIDAELGFNPCKEKATSRSHPSRDLNDIYSLVGKGYSKRAKQVQRTIYNLDYEQYRVRKDRLRPLRHLVSSILQFLAS